MFSTISLIAALTRSGNAVAPTDLIWLLFFTAVPLLLMCLGGPSTTSAAAPAVVDPPGLLKSSWRCAGRVRCTTRAPDWVPTSAADGHIGLGPAGATDERSRRTLGRYCVRAAAHRTMSACV